MNLQRTRMTCTTCIYLYANSKNEWPCNECPAMKTILKNREENDQTRKDEQQATGTGFDC